jgi:putative transposase
MDSGTSPHVENRGQDTAGRAKGFTPLEKRWVVERTNAWHGRSRRHSKDDERTPESSGAMIYMSNIHLMLRRLTSHCRPAFHYRSVTADALKLVS